MKCGCHEINLNGMNLSEVRLLRLLERISQGYFTNLMTLMMVIAAKRFYDICLKYLMQDGNGIGDRGAEMIGEGLKVNSSLRTLHLVRRLEDRVFVWTFL